MRGEIEWYIVAECSEGLVVDGAETALRDQLMVSDLDVFWVVSPGVLAVQPMAKYPSRIVAVTNSKNVRVSRVQF